MLCNQLLLFPTRPKPHSLLHCAATMLPWLFCYVLLTRTLGTGLNSHVLTKRLIITCKGEFT